MARDAENESQTSAADSRGRVRFLLDAVWRNNQRAMARDLGVTQGLVSKVVNGLQAPGPRLLTALSRHPRVNEEWVYAGVGEPLASPTAGTLPVALGVLPGSPADYPQLMTGERHPVAAVHDRPHRYLMRVGGGCPLLGDRYLGLLVGDLLMMEGDRGVWADRIDQFVGCVFGVSVPRPGGPEYTLGILRHRDGLFVDLCPGELRPGRPVPVPGGETASPPPVRRRIDPKKFHLGSKLKEKAGGRSASGVPESGPTRSADVDPPEDIAEAEAPADAVASDATAVFRLDDLLALRVYTLRPGP